MVGTLFFNNIDLRLDLAYEYFLKIEKDFAISPKKFFADRNTSNRGVFLLQKIQNHLWKD